MTIGGPPVDQPHTHDREIIAWYLADGWIDTIELEFMCRDDPALRDHLAARAASVRLPSDARSD